MNSYKRVWAVYLGLLLVCMSSCKMGEIDNTHTLFVGTYTDSGSKGIYSYTFNSQTGQLTEKTLAAATPNPSFIKISPDKKYMYAVNETNTVEENSGAVTSFKINDGQLTPQNTVSSFGAHPCHIGISKDGSMVAVSNYTGGNVALFKVDDTGKLKELQVIDHTKLDSTKTSHTHSALFSNDKLFVADLGLDVVNAYPLLDGGIDVTKKETLQLPEKAGPRHFVFSENATFLYVINELNSTITVYERTEDASYTILETKSTVAEDFQGESYCADIRLSADGKFLYGSNRGENTIVIYSINKLSGKLSLVGRESVKGDWPRNFNLDPSGNFLLVANQRSNNITVYKRDKENGGLTFIHQIALPSPVCLEFLD